MSRQPAAPNPRLARIAQVLGVLGAILGLIAVGKHAFQGDGLMGPGWAAVVSGLAVVYTSRVAAKR